MPDIGGALVVDTRLSGELRTLLESDDLRPGDDVSYALCKAIFIGHPLGAKMAETPIRLAQSQDREIQIPDSPEDDVKDAFVAEWNRIDATRLILNLGTQSRVYGIASIVMGEKGPNGKPLGDSTAPVDLKTLWQKELFFNVLDPLNTAGSLVTSQDPNSALYQKWGDLYVQGERYHRSRSIVLMNEEPLYISWTTSAFGFVGRSVYQRALFPLKSFVQTMITDDMVTRKAGLIVARMEQVGSIVDRIVKQMWGLKRSILKMARTDNVISVGKDEIIETLNMRNVNDSMDTSRNNIIKNVATAADMPAKLLTQESFVEGFGEGTQDAYAVAQYVDRVRIELRPVYEWFDIVCMYRAWSPEFYETIQKKYPDEYGKVPYVVAFYRWRNSFKAVWPPLIKEKPSEAADRDKVKLDALESLVEKLVPLLDPVNKAHLIQTIYDQLNQMEALFGAAKFELDSPALLEYMATEVERARQAQEDLRQAKMQLGGVMPAKEGEGADGDEKEQAENRGGRALPRAVNDGIVRLIADGRNRSIGYDGARP